MTELCSECELEEIACRCPPPTASLMGLLRDFRNADADASANGTAYANGASKGAGTANGTAYAHGTAYANGASKGAGTATGTAIGEAAAADPDR
jgi:hypothetical protein